MDQKKVNSDAPTRRLDWQPLSGGDKDERLTKPINADNRINNPGETVVGYDADSPQAGKDGAENKNRAANSFKRDPVVGWLVVVRGNGRGNSVELGKGQNTIGRSPDNHVRLDFGDDKISRESHCVIIFEPKRREFYIRNAEGRNLTYVADTVVIDAKQLNANEIITIGDTDLRFVPLCGPDFSWDSALP